MNAKFAERYLFLNGGTHVVIVINAKNFRASITTAMIAATCKLLHIPVICATIGHASRLLSSALGPRHVKRIDYPSGQHELQALVHDAREKCAILLLDAYIADDYDGSKLADAIRLHRKETISVVWPVYTEMDVAAGPRFINCVKPEQCMVHLHDYGFAGIKKCGRNGHFLRQFPIWQSEGLTGEMMGVMKRTDHYRYLPPFPELSKYYDDFKDYIPTAHKPQICNLLSHLYSAAEATRQQVLNPITYELF